METAMQRPAISGAAATTTSYEVSVGSCSTPTPPASPAPSAARGTPVRRQLDFTGGGALENDDEEDEFLCRALDVIERCSEAKQRAPPCVCGRGLCVVERDDQSGQWKYVCPSRPKCKHVAFCEEVNLTPKSKLATRSHPKPSNPCTFNYYMSGPKTAVSVCPQLTGTATPVSVRPQVAGDSFQGAKFLVPSTPAKFIPHDAVAATPDKVSPQGSKFNEEPVCLCTAGKCKKIRIGKDDWFVCPIPKGKGACSYKVLVNKFAKYIVPSAQATPSDEVHPKSSSILHQSIVAVNTPSKLPMQPCGTPNPISSKPNDICYRCGEKGHWGRDCPNPKQKSPRDGGCFKCGMVGHWARDCPQRV